jgi:uncharacterized protein (DUF1810 family)
MGDADAFDLERFVAAQAPVYEDALAELRAGRKRSHWMWFVFPQLRGLGHSSMAERYGVASLAEARAYLAHPLLGPRLVACTRAVLAVEGRSLREVLGSPDDLKFGSCMTLFEVAAGASEVVFGEALVRWCGGRRDDRTLALIATGPARP